MNTRIHAGLLSPPSNIEVALQFLQVRISWEQPFTLNITHQRSENVITYMVFVNNHGISTYEEYNTPDTHYTYNLSTVNIYTQPSNICSDNIPQTFQVSAINRVGTSERSGPVSLHDALCTPGTHTVVYMLCHNMYTTVCVPGVHAIIQNVNIKILFRVLSWQCNILMENPYLVLRHRQLL